MAIVTVLLLVMPFGMLVLIPLATGRSLADDPSLAKAVEVGMDLA